MATPVDNNIDGGTGFVTATPVDNNVDGGMGGVMATSANNIDDAIDDSISECSQFRFD